mgnify:CR=1 FL=1
MKFKLNKLVLISLILAPILLTVFVSSFLKRNDLVRELKVLQRENEALSKKNEDLQSFIKYFSLQASREREARARLNLAKPGETLVIFVVPTPSPTPTDDKDINLMQRFFRWLRK